jgi:hypothetical protein
MANILLREGWKGAASAQNCDIMQIFRIICKGLYLEIFLIQGGVVSWIKSAQLRFTRQLLQSETRLRSFDFYKIAALLRWACFRYALNSRAGSGLL